MDTPPYSDVSAQFSPSNNPNHVGPDPHPLPGPSAVTHPHPHTVQSASATGSGSASADLRALYTSSVSALDTTPPPTLREILSAYKQKGDGDRDMLLAMLNAKTAEDQRIASQLTLRRTVLEINSQTSEPHHRSYSYPQLTHSRSAPPRGHPYTYQPDEPYAHPASHYYTSGHHDAEAASPPAPSHSYAHRYAPPHSRAPPPPHAHISATESPPLSSVTQKASVLSAATRTRMSARPSSRGEIRTSDGRVYAAPPQFQTFRKKRQRSRSPSPVGSYRSYAYVRSPYTRPPSAGDPDRDAYTSPSESGTPPNAYGPGHPRAMAIGSLLSAKAASASANGSASTLRTNGPNRPPSVTVNGSAAAAAAPVTTTGGGRSKEDRPEQEDELEEEEGKQAWHRERERARRESREER